jgi:hypothetical protein
VLITTEYHAVKPLKRAASAKTSHSRFATQMFPDVLTGLVVAAHRAAVRENRIFRNLKIRIGDFSTPAQSLSAFIFRGMV